MDGSRFDAFARRWSSATTRRSILAVLAGAVASGIGRGAAAQTADGSGPVSCAVDADCLDSDLDPCTGAACADGICSYSSVACVPGYTCCGNGACCPSEGPPACASDADCAVTGDPCSGGRCEGGTCVVSSILCAEGFACCGNGGCCPIDDRCASDADCGPYANPCLHGRCLAGSCAPAFVSCPPGETCRDGFCMPFGE